MINLKIDNNIDELLLKIPITFELNDKTISDMSEMIRADIEKNLIQGTGIDGKSLEKKLKGGRLFFHSGNLMNSVKIEMSAKQGRIYISSPADRYAKYVNDGTNVIPQRQFFGISNRIMLKIDQYLLNNQDKIYVK